MIFLQFIFYLFAAVLFLFVVMMLDINLAELRADKTRRIGDYQ